MCSRLITVNFVTLYARNYQTHFYGFAIYIEDLIHFICGIYDSIIRTGFFLWKELIKFEIDMNVFAEQIVKMVSGL